MAKLNIIVVGAGAAGLLAAGRAAQAGATVTVLEKMARPGRKLAITGKGRCNLTNTAGLERFIERFGPTGKFLRPVFSQFFTDELTGLFESLGIELTSERGGRVFPAAGGAPGVVRALTGWARRNGAEIRRHTPVDALVLTDESAHQAANGDPTREHGPGRDAHRRRVRGVVAGGRILMADCVILATGGASYPATGSTGDGYRLAAMAGHTIVPVRPALVPLEIAPPAGGTQALYGLELVNVNLRLLVDGKRRRAAFGEMAFTETGITGPVILTLSGAVVDALGEKRVVDLSIDLKPALDEARLDARLRRDFAAHGREPLAGILRGLLPGALIPVCLAQTGLDPAVPGNQVTATARRRLHAWLKDFRLRVTGHRSFSEAIITAGGVATHEVDPRTMRSRLAAGLYFAGEILDLQADTGGYNLQAAFSTGWLAGKSAAEKEEAEGRRVKDIVICP